MFLLDGFRSFSAAPRFEPYPLPRQGILRLQRSICLTDSFDISIGRPECECSDPIPKLCYGHLLPGSCGVPHKLTKKLNVLIAGKSITNLKVASVPDRKSKA